MGRAPSVEGVEVAEWDRHSLDRWLANPRAMAPDTASRFPGYADAATREAVIRFLKRQQ
jgi:cytochrome c